MAAVVKKCRVCGKSYESCQTPSKTPGVFRWQEVACSPECGAEYLRRVMESRNPAPTEPKRQRKRVEAKPMGEMSPVDAYAIPAAESAAESERDAEAEEIKADGE